MHILLIHQAFASIEEPGGTRHFELAQLLAQKGHQVTIIASAVSYLSGKPEHLPVYEEQLQGRLRIFRVYTYPSLHKSFFHRLIAFLTFMVSSFLSRRLPVLPTLKRKLPISIALKISSPKGICRGGRMVPLKSLHSSLTPVF